MKTPANWLPAALLVLPLYAAALHAAPVETMKEMKPQSSAAMIKDALKAGPKSVTAKAAVMTMDGKTLREGTNGWVCYPGPHLKNGLGAMCLDEPWQKLVHALMSKAPFQGDKPGLAYMLAGDEGVSNTDPYATAKTPDNQWVVEGPHVMLLYPTASMLEGMPTDPKSGGPYVMWKGTPYAHVMMPLGKHP